MATGKIPLTQKVLKDKVDAYFANCARLEMPPTPSGLALALGVRTSALNDEHLSKRQRGIIDQAMQRIEASTMELMLTRGGIKGMESILDRVCEDEAAACRSAQIRQMSDEEILQRLSDLMPRVKNILNQRAGIYGELNADK